MGGEGRKWEIRGRKERKEEVQGREIKETAQLVTCLSSKQEET